MKEASSNLSTKTDPGINSWLEDELYQQYLHHRSTVDETWKHLFEENGGAAPKPQPETALPPVPRPVLPEGASNASPLRGIAAKTAQR